MDRRGPVKARSEKGFRGPGADTHPPGVIYGQRFFRLSHRRTGTKEEPVIEAYLNHVEERKALGVPAKPLDPEQTTELVKLLQTEAKVL